MTISNAQRVERRLWIGSSDVAAICGVDNFKSITDVWYSKVFSADGWKGNAYTDAGDYAEEGLIRFAEDQLGIPRGQAHRNAQFKRNDNETPFSANLDGWVESLGVVIEAKQTGNYEEWGRPGSDEVPDKVIFQVHHQMYCSGAREAVVPCAMGYKGIRYMLYRVSWDQDIADFMLGECQRFWHEHVVPQIKPEGATPRLETLRLADREPEETVVLDEELVAKWHEARAAMSEWRKEKDKLDRQIIASLEIKEGSKTRLAEIGLARDGYIDYTSGPKGRRSLKWKAQQWQSEADNSK